MGEGGAVRPEVKHAAAVLVLRNLAEALTRVKLKHADFDLAGGGPDVTLPLWRAVSSTERPDENLDTMVRFWWAAACDGDVGLATSAVSTLEDLAEIRRQEGGPRGMSEREIFCSVVKRLAGAARERGYARKMQ